MRGPRVLVSWTVRTQRAEASFTFPKDGVFLVGLTVYAPDGTSIGTAQSVAVR